MKIADYEQMMAHLMRQGYNRGGYVRLKDGGRIQFQVGTYPKTNPQDLQKLRNYLKNL